MLLDLFKSKDKIDQFDNPPIPEPKKKPKIVNLRKAILSIYNKGSEAKSKLSSIPDIKDIIDPDILLDKAKSKITGGVSNYFNKSDSDGYDSPSPRKEKSFKKDISPRVNTEEPSIKKPSSIDKNSPVPVTVVNKGILGKKATPVSSTPPPTPVLNPTPSEPSDKQLASSTTKFFKTSTKQIKIDKGINIRRSNIEEKRAEGRDSDRDAMIELGNEQVSLLKGVGDSFKKGGGAGGVGGIVGAVGAFVVVFKKYFKKFFSGITKFFGKIVGAITSIPKAIGGLLGKLPSILSAGVKSIPGVAAIGGLISKVTGSDSKSAKSITPDAKAAKAIPPKSITSGSSNITNSSGVNKVNLADASGSNKASKFTSKVSNAFNALKKKGGSIVNSIKGVAEAAVKGLKSIGGKLTAVLPYINELMGKVQKYVKGIKSRLDSIGKGIWGKLANKGKSIWGQSITKSAAKTGGKTFLKRLPFIGLLVGAYLGAKRLGDGDLIGGLLEIGSGMATLLDLILPGAGLALGLSLQAVLVAKDAGAFKGDKKAKSKPKPATIRHGLLGDVGGSDATTPATIQGPISASSSNRKFRKPKSKNPAILPGGPRIPSGSVGDIGGFGSPIASDLTRQGAIKVSTNSDYLSNVVRSGEDKIVKGKVKKERLNDSKKKEETQALGNLIGSTVSRASAPNKSSEQGSIARAGGLQSEMSPLVRIINSGLY